MHNNLTKIGGAPNVQYPLKNLSYYIYVYLDPFDRLEKPVKMKINGKDYTFYYRPFYIGKAISNTSQRMYQHIADYVMNRQRIKNLDKHETFKHIEKEIKEVKENGDRLKYDLPADLKMYKNHWIVVGEEMEHDPLEEKKELDGRLDLVEQKWITEVKKHFKLDNYLHNRK